MPSAGDRPDSFGAKGTLDVNDTSYEIYRLDAVQGDGLDVDSLPYSLKVLLENLLRTEDGEDITADDIRAVAGWDADAEPDSHTDTHSNPDSNTDTHSNMYSRRLALHTGHGLGLLFGSLY